MARTFTSEIISEAATACPLAPVDAGISYPSFMPLDDFIDVERLRSLHDLLTERIKEHMVGASLDYFVNEHRLHPNEPYRPGTREIWLSRTLPGTPYNYLDLDRPDRWRTSADLVTKFGPLIEFIATLPFSATGRMLIIYDDSGAAVPAHRDHTDTSICNEFIWMRTNFDKPFYLLNAETTEKKYVDSYTAWFDSVNQFHGCDAADGLTFSIRVDGVFTDEFRKQISKPTANRASTPSLWACTRRDRR